MRKKIKSCLCVVLSVLIAVFSFSGLSANAYTMTYKDYVAVMYQNGTIANYSKPQYTLKQIDTALGTSYVDLYSSLSSGYSIRCWVSSISNLSDGYRFYYRYIFYNESDAPTPCYYSNNLSGFIFSSCSYLIVFFDTNSDLSIKSIANSPRSTSNGSYTLNDTSLGYYTFWDSSIDNTDLDYTLADDGTFLYGSTSSNGWFAGIKSFLGLDGESDFSSKWTGETSLLWGLLDIKSSYENDLATRLTDSLGTEVTVGSTPYNEIATDLVNNTTTSNYWNDIDNSTKNSLRQTYNNLKNTFDNSVSCYTDGDNNYYYNTSTNEGDSNYFNYEGDTNTYYQTYIYYSSDDDDTDVTVAPSGGSSSGGGNAYAYATAIAEGGNAEVNQGDIIINVPSSSGGGDDGNDDGDSEDVDVSIDDTSFKKIVEDNKTVLDLIVDFFSSWDNDIKLAVSSLFIVVIICRLFGR